MEGRFYENLKNNKKKIKRKVKHFFSFGQQDQNNNRQQQNENQQDQNNNRQQQNENQQDQNNNRQQQNENQQDQNNNRQQHNKDQQDQNKDQQLLKKLDNLVEKAKEASSKARGFLKDHNDELSPMGKFSVFKEKIEDYCGKIDWAVRRAEDHHKKNTFSPLYQPYPVDHISRALDDYHKLLSKEFEQFMDKKITDITKKLKKEKSTVESIIKSVESIMDSINSHDGLLEKEKEKLSTSFKKIDSERKKIKSEIKSVQEIWNCNTNSIPNELCILSQMRDMYNDIEKIYETIGLTHMNLETISYIKKYDKVNKLLTSFSGILTIKEKFEKLDEIQGEEHDQFNKKLIDVSKAIDEIIKSNKENFIIDINKVTNYIEEANAFFNKYPETLSNTSPNIKVIADSYGNWSGRMDDFKKPENSEYLKDLKKVKIDINGEIVKYLRINVVKNICDTCDKAYTFWNSSEGRLKLTTDQNEELYKAFLYIKPIYRKADKKDISDDKLLEMHSQGELDKDYKMMSKAAESIEKYIDAQSKFKGALEVFEKNIASAKKYRYVCSNTADKKGIDHVFMYNARETCIYYSNLYENSQEVSNDDQEKATITNLSKWQQVLAGQNEELDNKVKEIETDPDTIIEAQLTLEKLIERIRPNYSEVAKHYNKYQEEAKNADITEKYINDINEKFNDNRKNNDFECIYEICEYMWKFEEKFIKFQQNIEKRLKISKKDIEEILKQFNFFWHKGSVRVKKEITTGYLEDVTDLINKAHDCLKNPKMTIKDLLDVLGEAETKYDEIKEKLKKVELPYYYEEAVQYCSIHKEEEREGPIKDAFEALDASCSKIRKKYFGENKIESENQSQMSSEKLVEDTDRLIWQYKWHCCRSEIPQKIKDIEEHYSEFRKYIDEMRKMLDDRKEALDKMKETLSDEKKKEFRSEENYHKELENTLSIYEKCYKVKFKEYEGLKLQSRKSIEGNLEFNLSNTKNLIIAANKLDRHQRKKNLRRNERDKPRSFIEVLRKAEGSWKYMKRDSPVSPLLPDEVGAGLPQDIKSPSLSGKTNESLKEPLSVEAALKLPELPIKDSLASEQHDFTLDEEHQKDFEESLKKFRSEERQKKYEEQQKDFEEQQKRFEESLKKFREAVKKNEMRHKNILDKIERRELDLPWDA